MSGRKKEYNEMTEMWWDENGMDKIRHSTRLSRIEWSKKKTSYRYTLNPIYLEKDLTMGSSLDIL